MRSIRNQAIAQDPNLEDFPDGQIINQTDTDSGTPVTREVYGDVITNIYAILRDAGIIINEVEDSNSNGYQLLQALKKFTNELNDVRKVVTISDNVNYAGPDLGGYFVNIDIDIDPLPLDYMILVKLSETLLVGNNYILKGTGDNQYEINVTSTFEASSNVILIINQNETNIIGLGTGTSIASNVVNTNFGAPLSFNDSNNVMYLNSGIILDNNPSSNDVESVIQTQQANQNLNVIDAILHKGKLICLTYDSLLLSYKAFSFSSGDLTSIEGEIDLNATENVENGVYMYCDGTYVYFTNSEIDINGLPDDPIINRVIDDNKISRFIFNPDSASITFESSIIINVGFEKTTNAFIDNENSYIYTFIEGQLKRYDFNGNVVNLGYFNGLNGVVFKHNNSTYFTNGSLANKWNL